MKISQVFIPANLAILLLVWSHNLGLCFSDAGVTTRQVSENSNIVRPTIKDEAISMLDLQLRNLEQSIELAEEHRGVLIGEMIKIFRMKNDRLLELKKQQLDLSSEQQQHSDNLKMYRRKSAKQRPEVKLEITGINPKIVELMNTKRPYVNIHLDPTLEPVRNELSVPQSSKAFRLRNWNYLPAEINGRNTELLVDSGSSRSFISSNAAEELGVLVAKGAWEKTELYTLTGRTKVDMAIIPDQTIELGNRFNIRTRLAVLKNSTSPLLLGAIDLKRHGCIQTFSADGTIMLFFRHHEDPAHHNWCSHEFLLRGFLGEEGHFEKPFRIKIDTGINKTVASKSFVENLKERQNPAFDDDQPFAIRLLDGRGQVLEIDEIVVMDNPGDDLCIGNDFFVRYQAIIDYGSGYIYFKVKDQTFRLKILDSVSHSKLKISALLSP